MSERLIQYAKLQSLLFDAPLAVTKERAMTLAQIIGPRLLGLASDVADAPVLAGSPFGGGLPKLEDIEIRDNVAIVPVGGTFVPKADAFDTMSGMVSYSRLLSTLQALDADPRVKGMVLGFDSPGGVVTGVAEASAAMKKLKKPIYASVAMQMASAAYWLGANAEKIFVSPTASTGSIGVLAMRRDESAKDAKDGIAYTFITSGERKADGNPHLPLTTAEEKAIAARVAEVAQLFFADVAASRDLSIETIEGLQGRSVLGAEALSVGLADAEGGFDDAVAAMIADVRGGSSLSLAAIKGGSMKDNETKGADTATASDVKPEAAVQPEAKKADVIDINKLRADTKKEMQQEEQARQKSIADLCKLAKRPDLALGFVTEGKTVAEVQEALLALDADAQASNPVSSLTAAPSGAPVAFNVQGFFAKRKQAVLDAQAKRAADMR